MGRHTRPTQLRSRPILRDRVVHVHWYSRNGCRQQLHRRKLHPRNGQPQQPIIHHPTLARRPRHLPDGHPRRWRQHRHVESTQQDLNSSAMLEHRLLPRRHNHHPRLQRPQAIRLLRLHGLPKRHRLLLPGNGSHDRPPPILLRHVRCPPSLFPSTLELTPRNTGAATTPPPKWSKK